MVSGVKGCHPNTGKADGTTPKTALPTSCTDWITTTDEKMKKKKKKGGKTSSLLCHSAFFVDVEKKFRSSAMTSGKICKAPPEDSENIPEDCTLWGVSPGRICNAEDFRRIGQFVNSWGTHYVTEGTFGGEMRVDVQTKKDRRALGAYQASTEQTANAAFEALWSTSILDFLHSDSGAADADALDTEDAKQTEGSNRADKQKHVNPFAHADSLNGALSPMWDAFASGSQKTTDTEHAKLERHGVERIGITFEGGEDIPAPTGKLQAKDVRRWAKSLSSRPKILQNSMEVVPISVLFSHPSVYARIQEMAAEDAKGDAKKVKAFAAKLSKSLYRKRRTLENYLRWWQLEAAQTGKDLDAHSRMLAEQRHLLRRLQAIPRKFLDSARTMSVSGTELQAQASETEDGVAVEAGSKTLPIHPVSAASGAGSAFFLTGSDNAAQSEEMRASELLVSHAVLYVDTQQQYLEACKESCRLTRSISERKTLMYGSFVLSLDRRYDAPLPRQYDVHKRTRVHRQTLASLTACYEECQQGQDDIAQSSQAINEDVTDPLGIQLSETFFKGAENICPVCIGLVGHTAQSVLDMGRGFTDNREVCSNLPMMTLLDRSLNNVDAILDDMNEHSVRKKRAAMLTCMGLSLRLEQKIMEILSASGQFYMAQPTLFKVVQQLMRRQERPDPDALASKMCNAFAHCSSDAQRPIDNQLEDAETDLSDAEDKLQRLEVNRDEQREQLKTVKSVKMSKENQQAAEQSVKALEAKVKEGKKALQNQEKALKELKESQQSFDKAEQLNEEKCRFVCLRATAWGKEYEKTRNFHPQDVREDPLNEKIAARSTEPCGLTALIPRTKKKGCDTGCTNKLCLWNAGRACLRMGAGASFLEVFEAHRSHLRHSHRRAGIQKSEASERVSVERASAPKKKSSKPSNGKTLICDSRWLQYQGEYIDVELPYVQGRRLARL